MVNRHEENTPCSGPYLRAQAAAKYLNLAPSTFYAKVAEGIFRPMKLSPGVTLFAQSQLDEAVAKRAMQGGR